MMSRSCQSSTRRPPARLIVNADDFGYFDGVTSGILDAARRGAITATGVLTNSPGWPAEAQQFRVLPGLDVGVHLTLTSGRPLTSAVEGLADPATGNFRSGKTNLVRALLSGRVRSGAVEIEWDAQIVRCRQAGIEPVFLNSHEHIHMLPPLFSIVQGLARKHGIEWVRWSSPEWLGMRGASTWIRGMSLQVFTWMNRGSRSPATPIMIGLSRSGRLDFPWLRNRLGTLEPGRVYELMCHPGRPADGEQIPARLRRYHDWVGEFEALCEAKATGLFESPQVRLIRFRDLSPTPAGAAAALA